VTKAATEYEYVINQYFNDMVNLDQEHSRTINKYKTHFNF